MRPASLRRRMAQGELNEHVPPWSGRPAGGAHARRRAVTAWPHELTYAELDQRANRLANHLRALGAGPESMVGVCLHRRVELVVALLAVWKAGAAYVPLDPVHPQERLAWIVADTGATIALTDEKFADGVRGLGARPVRVDADWPEIAECPATAPDVEPSPLGAAYVMYTSGSTGRPKGVVVTHEGIAGRVMWTVATTGCPRPTGCCRRPR